MPSASTLPFVWLELTSGQCIPHRPHVASNMSACALHACPANVTWCAGLRAILCASTAAAFTADVDSDVPVDRRAAARPPAFAGSDCLRHRFVFAFALAFAFLFALDLALACVLGLVLGFGLGLGLVLALVLMLVLVVLLLAITGWLI